MLWWSLSLTMLTPSVSSSFNRRALPDAATATVPLPVPLLLLLLLFSDACVDLLYPQRGGVGAIVAVAVGVAVVGVADVVVWEIFVVDTSYFMQVTVQEQLVHLVREKKPVVLILVHASCCGR